MSKETNPSIEPQDIEENNEGRSTSKAPLYLGTAAALLSSSLSIANSLHHHNQAPVIQPAATPEASPLSLIDTLEGYAMKLVREPNVSDLRFQKSGNVLVDVQAKYSVQELSKLQAYEQNGTPIKIRTHLVVRPLSLGQGSLMNIGTPLKWLKANNPSPFHHNDSISGTAQWKVDPTLVPPSQRMAIVQETTSTYGADDDSTKTVDKSDVVDAVVQVDTDTEGRVINVRKVDSDKITPGDVFRAGSSEYELSRAF